MSQEQTETPSVQKQILNFNGKEYDVQDLTEEQLLILKHLLDIEGQINPLNFKLQQLSVTYSVFLSQLERSFGTSHEQSSKTNE